MREGLCHVLHGAWRRGPGCSPKNLRCRRKRQQPSPPSTPSLPSPSHPQSKALAQSVILTHSSSHHPSQRPVRSLPINRREVVGPGPGHVPNLSGPSFQAGGGPASGGTHPVEVARTLPRQLCQEGCFGAAYLNGGGWGRGGLG